MFRHAAHRRGSFAGATLSKLGPPMQSQDQLLETDYGRLAAETEKRDQLIRSYHPNDTSKGFRVGHPAQRSRSSQTSGAPSVNRCRTNSFPLNAVQLFRQEVPTLGIGNNRLHCILLLIQAAW